MLLGKSIYAVIPLALTFFLLSCDDPDNLTNPGITKETKDFVIRGDYTNTTRANPEFRIISDSSDIDAISFGGIESTVQQGQVSIRFTNLSLADSNGNYVIESNESIRVEEKREGRVWLSDTEFSHQFEFLTTIGLVLVLDTSGSLGDDLTSVKDFAKEFLGIVHANIATAQIGVVVFSESIQTLPLTTSITAVEQFIDQVVAGANNTRLYDAMLQGRAMLDDLMVDGTALVSFTDGADNFSRVTSADVITALESSKTKSFMIGLAGKGNLDTQILSDLAVNGASAIAASIDVLQDIFQKFSREITNVYNITYLRNDQQIVNPMPMRFLITGTISVAR